MYHSLNIKIKIIKIIDIYKYKYNFKSLLNRFKNVMSLIYQRRSNIDDSHNSYNGATIQSVILSCLYKFFNIKNLKI